MRKLNFKGFTGLEIILIILVVGLLGGGGYYVWKKDKKPKATVTTSSSQTQQTEDKSEAKYLEIPEMGLKIKLNDKIEDAYYAMHPEGWAYLSVKSFDVYPNCKANSATGLAAVGFGKVGDDNFGEPFTEQELEDRGTKIGDKYYWIDLGQYDCSADENGENGDPNFSAVRSAFSQAEISAL